MQPKVIFVTLIAAVALPASAGSELNMTAAQFEAAQKQREYRFDGYPTKNRFNGKSAPLNLKNRYARTFKTRLTNVLAENKPNAAGKYSTFGFGCGSSGCVGIGAIDNKTGTPIYLGNILMGCGTSEEYGDFRSDPRSNLVIVSGCMDDRLNDNMGSSQFGYHYFLLKNGKFHHLRSVRVIR